MFQDKISKYIEFFRGIDIQSGVIIVKLQFHDNWGVVKYEDETIKIAQSDKVKNEWFFYGNVKDTTIDKIFDFVEYNIQFNQDMEKKKELFDVKKQELIELFSANDIDSLKTLKFILKKKSSKKINKVNLLEKKTNIEDKTIVQGSSEISKKQAKKQISNKVIEKVENEVIIKGNEIDNLDL